MENEAGGSVLAKQKRNGCLIGGWRKTVLKESKNN